MILNYIIHLKKVAKNSAGKPMKGEISVNSVKLYLRGVKSFFEFNEITLPWIDSVCSSAHGLPSEERSKIIETFLAEENLKEILLGRNKTNLVEKQPLIAQSRQPPAFWILYSWIFNLVHSEYIQVSQYPAASTSFRTVVSADHRSGLGPRTGHQGQ